MPIRLQHIRHKRARQAGFSLVEAMVAIAIFIIGVFGCYKMQLRSTHSNAIAERVSTATNWAVYQIEELLGKDYDDADFDDDGAGAAGAAGLDDLEANADGAIYSGLMDRIQLLLASCNRPLLRFLECGRRKSG